MEGNLLQCCYREQLRYSLYRKFFEPKLYRLAAKGEWENIPQRCQYHPLEASFRHKYPPEDTALHRILRVIVDLDDDCGDCDGDDRIRIRHNIVECKSQAIRALLNAYPAATTITDSFGRTPLHLACMDPYCAAEELLINITEEMYRQYPKAAGLVLDVERRTPLHYLMARAASDSVINDRLVRLLASSGEVVEQKDILGETALQILERRKSEVANADEIMAILKAVIAGDDATKEGIRK